MNLVVYRGQCFQEATIKIQDGAPQVYGQGCWVLCLQLGISIDGQAQALGVGYAMRIKLLCMHPPDMGRPSI